MWVLSIFLLHQLFEIWLLLVIFINVGIQIFSFYITNGIYWYIVFEFTMLAVIPFLTIESRSYRKHYALVILVILMIYSILLILLHTVTLLTTTCTELWTYQRKLSIILILNAMLIKTPVWPFSSWLPEAHAEASWTGSTILAGITLKYSILGTLLFSWSQWYCILWIFISGIILVANVILISYLIFSTFDSKKLIASTSVFHMASSSTSSGRLCSQLGVVINDIFWLTHSSVTGCLFTMIGLNYAASGSRLLHQVSHWLLSTMSTYCIFIWLSETDPVWYSSVVNELLILSSTYTSETVLLVSTSLTLLSMIYIWVTILISGPENHTTHGSTYLFTVLSNISLLSLPSLLYYLV